MGCVVGVGCCSRCCFSYAALYISARNSEPENGLGFGALVIVRT